jgi:hypothetical protein
MMVVPGQHAHRVGVHGVLDRLSHRVAYRLGEVHASDICDEKRMNRCNGEFHAAAPGSGIAGRTIEPALMVPQTEAAVLTEPCNLADKACNLADIG